MLLLLYLAGVLISYIMLLTFIYPIGEKITNKDVFIIGITSIFLNWLVIIFYFYINIRNMFKNERKM